GSALLRGFECDLKLDAARIIDEQLPQAGVADVEFAPVQAVLLELLDEAVEVGCGNGHVVDGAGARRRTAGGPQRGASGVNVDDRGTAGGGEPGSRIAKIRTGDRTQAEHVSVEA